MEEFLEKRLLFLENLNGIDVCKMFMFTYQVKFDFIEILVDDGLMYVPYTFICTS